jgi:hypothetical protein
MYTNLDVMGSMIAATQGLTDAEGDRLAAESALQSAVAFTATELSDIAMLYGRANGYIERQAQLYDDLLAAAENYYNATKGRTYVDEQGITHTGDTSDPTFAVYEKTYDAYVKNKVDYEQATKESDAKLVAALQEQSDMSRSDAEQVVLEGKDTNELLSMVVDQLYELNGKEYVINIENTGGDGSTTSSGSSNLTSGITKHSGQFPAYHSGKFAPAGEQMAWVRNDELIAPPEKFREATDYLAERGYSASGTTYNISISGAVGNHKDIARRINREIQNLKYTREVAA